MSQEVDEIKARLSIVDLIHEYTTLLPAGTNFKARCPFHNEKTPSFIVTPHKQMWHCFGCNEGGDIFDFLMKIENIEFAEALKILANRAGVTLSRLQPELESKKNRLIRVCELAARYWHKILLESASAGTVREYVSGRGLTEETIEKFMIGYSPDSWDNTSQFLKKRGFSDQEIFLAGLTVKKDRGGYYDRFRGRLMFPIFDVHRQVVGFGGRALKPDETAKYINSPQTPIYNKSIVVYGLSHAKEAIRQANQCIMVEGYMDVIPSHQAGVANVVAISGTALTPDQVKVIKRFTDTASLALDMDAAGQLAATRSIDVLLAEEMNILVIQVPHGKDPGECIANNPDDWRQAIAKAQSIMDYFFSTTFATVDVSTPGGKKQAAKTLVAQINKLVNPVERDGWLKTLAQRLGVTETVVRELAGSLRKTTNRQIRPNPEVHDRTLLEADLMRQLLSLMLITPAIWAEIIDLIKPSWLGNTISEELYRQCIIWYTQSNYHRKSESSSTDGQDDMFSTIESYLREQSLDLLADLTRELWLLGYKDFIDIDANGQAREARQLIKNIKNNYLNGAIEKLRLELEAAELQKDATVVENIYRELNELIRQKGE